MATCTSITFALLLFIAVAYAKPTRKGFTFNLIHRDSPYSPLYDPNHSRFTQTAISRSTARAKWISTVALGLESKSDVAEPQIISYEGPSYMMNISIGTPPFPIIAGVSTASDFIWTQCEPSPCYYCSALNGWDFKWKKSSSYKRVLCPSPKCKSGNLLDGYINFCTKDSKYCQYSVTHVDNTSSHGVIATETFTLRSSSAESVKFQNIVFGCSFYTYRQSEQTYGLGNIGLGNGKNSLIQQLNNSIGGKFSYCLAPPSTKESKSGVIHFGDNAVVSSNGVVSTPLVEKKDLSGIYYPSAFYYITLNAITIGKKRIAYLFGRSNFEIQKGNIIIDSGTPLLYFPTYFYSSLVSEIKKQVDAKPVYKSSVPLELCYDTHRFKAPEMLVHFDGADVKLNQYNAWVEVMPGVVCFAASPTEKVAIYGSLAQVNFLVGYDKQGKKISFKPADCKQQN